jgi:F-box-like
MSHVHETCCGLKQAKVSDYSQVHPDSSVTDMGDTGSDSDRLYPHMTIDKLPDDVLLEIFVYVVGHQEDYCIAIDEPKRHEGGWRTLVHVCKRWRSVVLSSPRRLDLRLFCTNTRPVKKLLDIWPPLPIYIHADHPGGNSPLRGVTNLLAGLKQQNRVWGIEIWGVPNSLLKKSVAMKPFPALTSLSLSSNDEKAPVIPDLFLGGSAPRLQGIRLEGIPFPGIGKLLLSTTDLVLLSLHDIPHSGYVSPEAIVASLSTLTRLDILFLRFRSPRSRADRENRHPSPLKRFVFPALTLLSLKGDSEYVEDIMSRIDVPLLDDIDITFFNQLVFHTPQLREFINRTGNFKAPDCPRIFFDDRHVTVEPFRTLSLRVLCRPSDWQLSSLSQLYISALSPLPTLEHLEIHNPREYWEDDMENVQWLELLHLFPSVKDLVLSRKSLRLVAPALDELAGESVTEVLPALQNIVLQGSQPSEPDNNLIGKFISTRQLLGSPVTIQHRDGKDLDDYDYQVGDR